MEATLKLLSVGLFDAWSQQVDADLRAAFEALQDAGISTATFSFSTSVSAIASSRIEGEQMEIDSYLKHRMLNVEYQPDLVQKPDDLYKAYLFAQQNHLTTANFLTAHRSISAHLLPAGKQGAFRQSNMVVMEHNTGRIQYEAAPAASVPGLFAEFWTDIGTLMNQPLTDQQVSISPHTFT